MNLMGYKQEKLNKRLKEWAKPNVNGYVSNSNGGGIHRDIWIKHYGEIPKGCVIHHINHNKKDNRIENLKCVTQKEHKLIHAEHKFQQMLNK